MDGAWVQLSQIKLQGFFSADGIQLVTCLRKATLNIPWEATGYPDLQQHNKNVFFLKPPKHIICRHKYTLSEYMYIESS